MTWPLMALISAMSVFGIGLIGLLLSRNLIKTVVAMQLLGKAAMIALAAAGNARGQPALGQSLALGVIVADTIVAVIALALAVQIRRKTGTLDLAGLASLRR